MHDNALALEILRQIEEAARKVVQRFRVIKDPSDFSDSDAGMEKMDAICMMLKPYTIPVNERYRIF